MMARRIAAVTLTSSPDCDWSIGVFAADESPLFLAVLSGAGAAVVWSAAFSQPVTVAIAARLARTMMRVVVYMGARPFAPCGAEMVKYSAMTMSLQLRSGIGIDDAGGEGSKRLIRRLFLFEGLLEEIDIRAPAKQRGPGVQTAIARNLVVLDLLRLRRSDRHRRPPHQQHPR
jgi:hypothetical protein